MYRLAAELQHQMCYIYTHTHTHIYIYIYIYITGTVRCLCNYCQKEIYKHSFYNPVFKHKYWICFNAIQLMISHSIQKHVKYINHLKLIVCNYEPLTMYDDKVYWKLSQRGELSKSWKTVSLCMWPRHHLHNGWHHGMYAHFWLDPGWARPYWECACVTQINWRDHDQ